jgi:hypothetical protein
MAERDGNRVVELAFKMELAGLTGPHDFLGLQPSTFVPSITFAR